MRLDNGWQGEICVFFFLCGLFFLLFSFLFFFCSFCSFANSFRNTWWDICLWERKHHYILIAGGLDGQVKSFHHFNSINWMVPTFWSPNRICRRALRLTFMRHKNIRCSPSKVGGEAWWDPDCCGTLRPNSAWIDPWSCLSIISYTESPCISKSSYKAESGRKERKLTNKNYRHNSWIWLNLIKPSTNYVPMSITRQNRRKKKSTTTTTTAYYILC